jgi:hypothetical protein
MLPSHSFLSTILPCSLLLIPTLGHGSLLAPSKAATLSSQCHCYCDREDSLSPPSFYWDVVSRRQKRNIMQCSVVAHQYNYVPDDTIKSTKGKDMGEAPAVPSFLNLGLHLSTVHYPSGPSFTACYPRYCHPESITVISRDTRRGLIYHALLLLASLSAELRIGLSTTVAGAEESCFILSEA